MKRILVLGLIIITIALNTGCKSEDTNEEYIYPIINGGFNEEIDNEADYAWDTYFFGSEIELTDMANEGTGSIKVTATAPGGFISIWQVLPIKDTGYKEKFNKQAEALFNMESDQFQSLKPGDAISMSVDLMVDEAAYIEDTTSLRLYIEAENDKGIKTTIGESGIEDVVKGEWFTLSTLPSSNEGIIPDDTVLIVVSVQMDLPEDGFILVDNVKVRKNVEK